MEVDANSGQLISKLYSVSYGDLNGKKIQERVDISIHIAESGFPGSSAGKESDCNAGDPGLIPGSGRSPGEGIGYPLQYSWASLMAQLVKNPPTTWETLVRFLGWEDPLEEVMATHFSILS